MGKRPRPGFFESIRLTRSTLRARGVFLKAFAFTAPVPAYRVVEAIERRWGREVQDELDFYVESVIPGQQVILVFGKTEVPRIFAARIDFQSPDPVAGTLWFFDGESYALGTEAAEVFHTVFARLLADVSPDAEIHEHEGEIVIATSGPVPDWRARRGSHRKK